MMQSAQLHRPVNTINAIDPDCEINFLLPATKTCLTVVMCTIERSTSTEVLLQMIEAGMNIARISIGNVSYQYHIETIKNLRTAVRLYSEQLGFECPMAIALDTHGTEIRTGKLDSDLPDKIRLEKGDMFRLTNNRDYIDKGTKDIMYIDYENIINFVKVGDRIYLEHGNIRLYILDVQVNTVVCKVETSGQVGSKASVNLPGIETDLPSITEKDKADFKFSIEQGVDMVIISMVRRSETVKHVRSILGDKGKHISVIAKIENQHGIENLEDIIRTSDGILIGRCDLSIELPIERLFLGQKAIIARCNRLGKPVIFSGQVLESMIRTARPAMSQVIDVANAVLDGADCVALGKETATGIYPVEAVDTLTKICHEAESTIWYQNVMNELIRPLKLLDAANSIGVAAVEAAMKCNASIIAVVTTSGRTAQMISKYKPRCPILAITRYPESARQTQLYRGIIPLIYTAKPNSEWLKDVDARVNFGLRYASKLNLVNTGDPVVVVAGWKEGSGFTNTLRIIYAFNSGSELAKKVHQST